MNSRTVFATVREILADLYPDDPSARRAVIDAGLAPRRVAFSVYSHYRASCQAISVPPSMYTSLNSPILSLVSILLQHFLFLAVCPVHFIA